MSIPTRSFSVSDVMLSPSDVPVILETTIFKEALELMVEKHLGIACIINNNNVLTSIITDGDIRRMLLRVQKPFSAFFIDDSSVHSVKSPLTVLPDDSLRSAVKLMDKHRVWDLPVVDQNGVFVGLLHLHPAIEALLDSTI